MVNGVVRYVTAHRIVKMVFVCSSHTVTHIHGDIIWFEVNLNLKSIFHSAYFFVRIVPYDALNPQ